MKYVVKAQNMFVLGYCVVCAGNCTNQCAEQCASFNPCEIVGPAN